MTKLMHKLFLTGAAVLKTKTLAVVLVAIWASLFGGKAYADFLMQSLDGERVDLHNKNR